MLKKLMKYEFMATGRVFLPLFAALILISLVNKLLSYLPVDAPQIIGTIISVILMVGIIVLTLVITVQRFRSNLMSNEGYLMMTLPVSTDRLILSKMFVASIWTVASGIVVIISIMIMAMSSISFADLAKAFRPIGEYIAASPARSTVYIIEIVVMIAVSVFSGILMLYTCLALSMLVNKRRGLFSFGAFIVITTAMQIIVTLLGVAGVVFYLPSFQTLSIYDLDVEGLVQTVFLIWLVLEAAFGAAFYFITRFMLKNRLNLQ
jgi:hypothetical protein